MAHLTTRLEHLGATTGSPYAEVLARRAQSAISDDHLGEYTSTMKEFLELSMQDPLEGDEVVVEQGRGTGKEKGMEKEKGRQKGRERRKEREKERGQGHGSRGRSPRSEGAGGGGGQGSSSEQPRVRGSRLKVHHSG